MIITKIYGIYKYNFITGEFTRINTDLDIKTLDYSKKLNLLVYANNNSSYLYSFQNNQFEEIKLF